MLLPGHDATSRAGSQRTTQGCPELHPSVLPLPPCGHGLWDRSSLLGVQLRKPGQPHAASLVGTGCWPSRQPGAPGPVCGSKAFPSGDRATWLSTTTPNPAPSPLSSKVAAVPGLCQHAARLRCAGPGAVAWNGHLLCLNPHSQRVRDPLELGGRRARTRERPRFAVYPAEWQGSPGKPG